MFDENSAVTNEQKHQQLVTALRESEILRELAGLLASSLDINEILHILVKRTTEVCEVQRCAVWLLNEARSFSVFQPITAHLSTPSFDQSTLEAANRVWNRWLLPLDNPLVERLLSAEGMIVVEDLRDEPTMQKMAEKLLVKSVLLVPLIREGRPVGMMSLDDPNTIRTFSSQQQQLAQAIAQQATLAIDNARLYKQTHTERQRAEQLIERAQSIYEVALAVNKYEDLSMVLEIAVKALVRGLKADHGVMVRLDTDTHRLISVTNIYEKHMAYAVALEDLPSCFQAAIIGAPRFVMGTQTIGIEKQWYEQLGMENVLIVPLMAGKHSTNGREAMSRTLADISDCVGFAFINYKPDIQPSKGHYAFAQDIAAQCALAIEKAYLLNEVRQREKEANERANTLNAIFQAMTEGITVLNQEGEVLVRNRAASRFLKTPMSDSDTMRLTESIQRFPFYTPQGQLLTEHDFPLARALKGERIQGERIITASSDEPQRVLEVNVTPLLNEQQQQVGIVSAFRDITEQVEIDESIRLALATLLQITEAVSAITDTTEIMCSVLDMALNTLNCDRGIVQLYDQEKQHFIPLLSAGYATEEDAQWLMQCCTQDVTREIPCHNFYEQILAGNATVVQADKCPDQPAHLHHLRVLAAPITHNGRLLGLLMIDHSPYLQLDLQRQEFSMWDIAIAEGIAQLAGLAIEQARWQQEATEARVREATMREESTLKDEFLAITAHEFNSPLAIILMQSQMTLRKLRKAPDRVSANDIMKALINIETQGQHLTNIVKTYLDVPKIKSGQLTLTMEPVDLVEIAEQAVENMSRIAKTHQFCCMIEPAEDPYLVRGDSASLTQIIANLLQNAVKYSPNGGPITIALQQCSSKEKSGTIQVSVEDRGLGIPPEAQEHLFERFYRASNINKKKTAGIGLGLYIVAELLHLQGGTISVESSGIEGEGSRFTFSLPLLERKDAK